MSVEQALEQLLMVLLLTLAGPVGWVVLGALLLAAPRLSVGSLLAILGVLRAADPVELR